MEQFVLWTLYRPPAHPEELVDLRLRQACFECAILHLRNLVDFLRNTRPMKGAFLSDLVADHYFETGWATRPEPFLLYSAGDVESDERVRANVNRHLAHITTSRQRLRVTRAAFVHGAPTAALGDSQGAEGGTRPVGSPLAAGQAEPSCSVDKRQIWW